MISTAGFPFERLGGGYVTSIAKYRPVIISDASFIYNLRQSDSRQMLTPLTGDIHNQVTYIEIFNDKVRNGLDEFYFIIEDLSTGNPVGTVRYTNLSDPSRIGWESLIIQEGTRSAIGIDAIFSAYRICFEILKRPLLGPWRVLARNSAMIRMHELMKMAFIVSADEETVWFAVTNISYAAESALWVSRGFGQVSLESELS